MLADSSRPGREGARQFAMYQGPALVLLLGLCAITIVSLAHPDQLTVTHSVTLDAAIQTASFVIALGTAYFALAQFLIYGYVSSLCVGLAFLIFAGGAAGMGLIPLILGRERALDWAPYGWGIERVAGGCALVAASILVDRHVSASLRGRLTAGAFCVGIVFNSMVALWTFYEGHTGVKRGVVVGIQIVAAMLFFIASGFFWRASRFSTLRWFLWLSFSLAIAGFAQLQYAINRYLPDLVGSADILDIVFFASILLALATQWSQQYRRLRWQTRELEALHSLMTVPVIEDVPAVVQHIVDTVGRSLSASARVLLSDRESSSQGDPLAKHMLHFQSESLAAGSNEDDNRIVVGFDEGERGTVAMGVPLRTSEQQVGMLVAIRGGADKFSSHDVRLLRAFGAQASVLLERSFLYEEVAAGAILQERSRLAREIHDGLAQHLAFLKMRVAWLQRSPAAVDATQLKDIEGVLETALIEARHAITTLRAEPNSASSTEAIVAYAEEFGQVSGLAVHVDIQSQVPGIGPKARVELLRIVQEAMNNVRKHAHASRIDVGINQQDGGAAVTIVDDGAGFQLDAGREGHFGLEIMRERAQSVGGTLDVESQPGAGTKVQVWVPVHDADLESGERRWLGAARG